MKVLVTGASGFCGSVVCIKLAQAGYEVFANYRRNNHFTDLLMGFENIKHIKSDLKLLLDIKFNTYTPFDIIVHAAATSPGNSITVNRMVYDNVEGTRSLINAASKWEVKKFIFYSSLSVYGEINQPIVDEDTPITNPDAYGTTKYLCELMLKENGIPSIAFRLPGIIGPKAHRNWQSSIAKKLLKREKIAIYNADELFNNSVHVNDIAAFIVELLNKQWEGFEVIVLGSIGAITIREAVERLAKRLCIKPDLEYIYSLKREFILNSSRAISYWSYQPMEIGALIDRYGDNVLNESN